MKYQWTDWIEHVPGQELPVGTYGLWEFHGGFTNGGVPFAKEGALTAKHKGHGCWYATDLYGTHCVIRRYKLRSIADETVEKRELEAAE